MFSENLNIMLYVEDVLKEREFWKNICFFVEKEEYIMDFPFFNMKTSENSNTNFTVYSKEFIKMVSPEVLNNIPSILFESSDIENLHKRVLEFSEVVSDLNKEPFLNFNFKSPSGIFFAVKGI